MQVKLCRAVNFLVTQTFSLSTSQIELHYISLLQLSFQQQKTKKKEQLVFCSGINWLTVCQNLAHFASWIGSSSLNLKYNTNRPCRRGRRLRRRRRRRGLRIHGQRNVRKKREQYDKKLLLILFLRFLSPSPKTDGCGFKQSLCRRCVVSDYFFLMCAKVKRKRIESTGARSRSGSLSAVKRILL